MAFLSKYLFDLLYLALMSAIGLTYFFHYQLLYHIGWGLSLFIGLVIALNVIFGNYLLNHKNPSIQKIGHFYSNVNGYTALFQGIMFINLVFYALGLVSLASTFSLHMWDWLYGMSYSGFIVYGIGCWVFVLYTNKISQKMSALIVVLSHLAIGMVVFLFENSIRSLYEQFPNYMIFLSFFIQLLSSVILYQVGKNYGKSLLKKNKSIS